MKKYFFYPIIILVLFSCSSKKQAVENKPSVTDGQVTLTDAQIKNSGLQFGQAQRLNMNTELKVNGVVDVPPQNIITVSFPLGGYLKSTKLLPGMHVSRGEIIAIMEDKALIQLQQDYLVATARLQYLQHDYERQKLLNESKVNADKVFQQAESDLASQKAVVKGYIEKLKLTGINPAMLTEATISRSVPIYSPINGFVSKVNVNIGKYVNPADVLFDLINPDDMHAVLTVYEKDISRIKAGQKVKVSFVDDITEEYNCEVLLVTRNVDENRTALVHCHFEEKPRHLLPGMFLNAKISISNADALVVPEEAVARFGNKQYVYEVLGNNVFKPIEVQTGVISEGRTELLNGNDIAFKKIVIKNAYAVLAKMKNSGGEE